LFLFISKNFGTGLHLKRVRLSPYAAPRRTDDGGASYVRRFLWTPPLFPSYRAVGKRVSKYSSLSFSP